MVPDVQGYGSVEVQPNWLTADTNTDEPSIARLYDYLLGGTHNLDVDRQLARKVLRAAPGVVFLMRENRKFLRRFVKFAIDSGVDQFLDIGAGIPTRGSVHETAQALIPTARIAYVDIDEVAIAHGSEILKNNQYATNVLADFLNPASILEHPDVTDVLDFERPVALMMLNILHFFPDSVVVPVMEQYRSTLAAGSILSISAAIGTNPLASAISEVYENNHDGFAIRSHDSILELFGDFELADPGLVFPPQWRPDRPGSVGKNPERYSSLVGAAIKPLESHE